MKILGITVAILLGVELCPWPSFGVEEELQTIPTRPGVTQSFVLIRPSGDPQASVILFAGETGALGLSPERIAQWKPTNFLMRNRIRFA